MQELSNVNHNTSIEISTDKDERINRKWFSNRLAAGLIEYKCTGIYTDDYRWDAENNFQIDEEWKQATLDTYRLNLKSWSPRHCWIMGDKDGEFTLHIFNAWYKCRIKKS